MHPLSLQSCDVFVWCDQLGHGEVWLIHSTIWINIQTSLHHFEKEIQDNGTQTLMCKLNSVNTNMYKHAHANRKDGMQF